ncbi:ATPase, T2SS/T4P/T4SS family [Photorhabdus sp. RM157S]
MKTRQDIEIGTREVQGTEGMDSACREEMLDELRQACGPVILQALADKNVVEIIINPDGKLWIESHNQNMNEAQSDFPAEAAERILLISASLQKSDIGTDVGLIEGEFPLGRARIAGVLPPLANAPAIAIRKHSPIVLSLSDYRKSGIIKPIGAAAMRQTSGLAIHKRSFEHPIEAIREAVVMRKNILIVGGTGSGKTTLTNTILHEISLQCPCDRIVAIEDTMELQLNNANRALLRTSKDVDMRRLLRTTMRLRPDRIVVGEIRGGEAYTLLKSWNSGHPGGVTTTHANSSEEGLQKLAHYIYEDKAAQGFTPGTIGWMIAKSVNLVIVIEKIATEPGRMVTEICEVTGFMNDRYNMNVLCLQSNGHCEFRPRI